MGQYQIRGETTDAVTRSIEAGIREGDLPPGTVLPPVRTLAARLGIAKATVAAAYRALRQRGIVDTAGRRGTTVRHRPAVFHSDSETLPSGMIDLSSGGPDPALLPDLTAALARVPTTRAGYRNAGRVDEMRQAVSERFAADGVHGAITLTGGALDGIERALSVHNGPSDQVAVEDPCWANMRDLILALGMRPIPVAVDDEGPDPDALGKALRGGARAFVLTSRAHNPTGAQVSAERAGQLREVLDGADVLAIEDDHWAELSDVEVRPVADAAARWLYVRSVSKPFGPDLRLAAACGDEETIARVGGRMRIGSGWVSTVLQYLVLELWRDPATADVLRHARHSYRVRREGLIAALAEHEVPAHGSTGLNVWIPVPDETHAVTLLRDNGFAVSPGAPFRIDSPPAIRVTISGIPESSIPALGDVIAQASQSPYPLA